jgi:cold shock CspA family protein
MQKRCSGIVRVFDLDKRYGFLGCSEGGHTKRIHYHQNAIRRDWRGSTAHAITEGATVSFLKSVDEKGRSCAVDVVGDFLEPEQDLAEYCEVSRIDSLNFSKRFGLLIRPDGGAKLFLHWDAVIVNREVGLKVGNFVFHRVRQDGEDRCGNPNWVACDAELFSEKEQARLQQGLPAYEQEPVPEVLTPENRNKSLFELIKEKRNATLPGKRL